MEIPDNIVRWLNKNQEYAIMYDGLFWYLIRKSHARTGRMEIQVMTSWIDYAVFTKSVKDFINSDY